MDTTRRMALLGAAAIALGLAACGKQEPAAQNTASDAQGAASTAASAPAPTAAGGVTGAGASFPAPLYAKWASEYAQATGVKVNYQSVGSGAGMKQIEAKTVDFGASDEPLKDD
ncbi:MAG: extracellular solute-binding protein, partial [Brachymonas sp.]|nr:extracellular solute-binding protein [Brachymonas sp.]